MPESPETEALLTTAEAARRLGCTYHRARDLALIGQLEARRVGGRTFVTAESVDAFSAAGRVAGAEESPPPVGATPLSNLERRARELSGALGRFLGAVTATLPPDQREAVLTALDAGAAHYELTARWPRYEVKADLVTADGRQSAVDLTAEGRARAVAAIAGKQQAAKSN
jgi:hypothetical protein